MAKNLTALGTNVIEVPFWWRKISWQEFSIVTQARLIEALHPVTNLSGTNALRALQNNPDNPIPPPIGAKIPLAKQLTMAVLTDFDSKLNHLLTGIHAGTEEYAPTPFQLHESGEGLTFWPKTAEINLNDLLEIRFSLFAELPLPFHGFCQVRRIRREWSGVGLRVECNFANLDTQLNPPPLPRIEPYNPAPQPPKEQKPVARARPIPQEEIQNISRPSEPTPNEPPHPEPLPLPTQRPEGMDEKLRQTLSAGVKILEAEIKTTTSHLQAESERPNRRPPGPRRQDFRVNDQMPLEWKIISQQTYDQAVKHFLLTQEFPPRERIVRQKLLWAEIDITSKQVRQTNIKARRPITWFRTQLETLFHHANSENEEEFFQNIILIFYAILKELEKRPREMSLAGQLLAHMKNQIETQEKRDRQDPITQKMTLTKANEDLDEITRQIKKMLTELTDTNPSLAEKLLGLHTSLSMINLTMQDRPKRIMADGKTIFLANLSATGLAWHTLKTWITKNDRLELRMGLSADGSKLESVLSYARVVAIQPSDDQKSIRIACFFEHMTPHHRQVLQAHIVRKQREALIRRAES